MPTFGGILRFFDLIFIIYNLQVYSSQIEKMCRSIKELCSCSILIIQTILLFFLIHQNGKNSNDFPLNPTRSEGFRLFIKAFDANKNLNWAEPHSSFPLILQTMLISVKISQSRSKKHFRSKKMLGLRNVESKNLLGQA